MKCRLGDGLECVTMESLGGLDTRFLGFELDRSGADADCSAVLTPFEPRTKDSRNWKLTTAYT